MSLYHKLAKPAFDTPFIIVLLVFETALTSIIVQRITYTEIDWIAYMQEVKGYEHGERDYINIRGDTGPLVYPAGFLYLYSWLKSLASGASGASAVDDEFDGSTTPEAIKKIQWVFVVLYVINCAVVLGLYQMVLQITRQRCQNQKIEQTSTLVWAWRIAMGITCLSKRIHSIFVLRLFNDAPAMLLLYISIFLFACCDAWTLGCVAFSLAVSIKMNVLLFAPGLLLLLLQRNGSILGTIKHLSICASVQVILGWPFLSTFPVSYIKKAFEFDRVFFYKWTVNWKFLPEELFISKKWALVLLSCHLGTLALLARKWWNASLAQRGHVKTTEWMCWTNYSGPRLSAEYIIYTMFVSNFIGIAFARTLHYQFYSWYFHSLPMMHWITTNLSGSSSKITHLSLIISIISVFGVEYAFNVYPASETSSMVLQLCHVLLLLKICWSTIPIIEYTEKHKVKKK
jgi:alpha-1,3-mannosyltransferase